MSFPSPGTSQIRGLYRIVRHPIYATYIVMDVGLVLSAPSYWNLGVFLAGLVLFLVRIQAEEEVLGTLEAYGAYRRRVPFRLVPGVY